MKNKKFVAIIQARLTSKRFPGKVIQKIGNSTVLEVMLKRLRKSKKIDQIVVSIPSNKKNKKLFEYLKKLDVNIFRGSEDNVLDRFYKTALKFKASDVIRITGDCPFIDPKIVDNLINLYSKKKIDYLNNAKAPDYSDGFDVEILNFKTLKKAKFKAKSSFDQEHVTPFIKREKNIKKLSVSILDNFGVKLSLDTKDDYKKIKKVFKFFHPNIHFSIQSIFKKKLHKKIFQDDLNKKNILDNKTKRGQNLWKDAQKVISGGNMLLSKNPNRYSPQYWPTYFKSAKGCKIIDLDGNRFVDFSLMGIGTNVLGYGNSKVDQAVRKVISNGNMSTLNCPEEVELAEKLINIHSTFDMVKFARSGGEANSIAIRISRAASSKDNIAICGYHGWHDWYLSANLNKSDKLDKHLIKGLEIKGVPKKLKKTVFPFNYGDFESLEKIVNKHNIGTIKMEVCRNTEPNINFLKKVRRIADKKKIILIFDECTTGFRESFGGLYKSTGINPDMVIFGKALGNGYAITAILGKSEIMEHSQKTFISSTFWTERIGPAAALQTIEVMEKEKTWKEINKIGKKIQKGWSDLANITGLKIDINGIPSLSNFTFKSEKNLLYKSLITQEMLKSNFLASNSVYCCIKHDDKILEKYFNNLEKVFKMIRLCEDGHEISKFLKSKPSIMDFQRLN
jgi:glutamate-1-semialdehyde 2,1-aminomutase